MNQPLKTLLPSFALTVCMICSLNFCAAPADAQGASARFDSKPTSEFHFARLVYSNAPYSRRGRGGASWAVDYPEAEYHLMDGIERMTIIDVELVDYDGIGGRLINLDNDTIFDYPWLYAVEVGQWYLSTDEAKRLREYLDRGGFLVVDDFWGPNEWQVFVASMKKVFPDRLIVEIDEADPVMSTVFKVDKSTQIPGRRGVRPGNIPYWRGIYDDQGRLQVAINFNMDMGDAWEHASDPGYPAAMTAMAYRFAVNYIVYSMTH